MLRFPILITESDRFSPRAQAILRELGDVRMHDLERPALLAAVRDAGVLWVRLRHRIDDELMAQGPNLKFIVTATTGLNHIDLAAAQRRGIRVLSLRGETEFLRNVRATAEHTVALALALLRHIPRACTHVCAGGWNRDAFWGRELHGKTVGIVGFGRVGRLVGEYFTVFGARVLATDPAARPEVLPPGVGLLPLESLLSQADVVTVHALLDESTQGLLGRREFAVMRQGAWLINTARGELLEEEAFLEALRSGRLAGAAVDVLGGESAQGMGRHPLVQYAVTHENLLITPHLGGCTVESVEKTEVFMAEKLRRLLTASDPGPAGSPPSIADL